MVRVRRRRRRLGPVRHRHVRRPAAARHSVFDVTYRVTAGAAGNVAADAITTVVPPGFNAVLIAADQPVPGDRRRGRGDPGSRPGRERRTRSGPASSAPSAPRTTRHRARAALGDRRRHRRTLDRELAHRLHHRPARGRADRGTEPTVASGIRAARPPPDDRLRGLHAPSPATSGWTSWSSCARSRGRCAVRSRRRSGSSSAPAGGATGRPRSSHPAGCASARPWSAATSTPRSRRPPGSWRAVDLLPAARRRPRLRPDAGNGDGRPRRDHPGRQTTPAGRTAVPSGSSWRAGNDQPTRSPAAAPPVR